MAFYNFHQSNPGVFFEKIQGYLFHAVAIDADARNTVWNLF